MGVYKAALNAFELEHGPQVQLIKEHLGLFERDVGKYSHEMQRIKGETGTIVRAQAGIVGLACAIGDSSSASALTSIVECQRAWLSGEGLAVVMILSKWTRDCPFKASLDGALVGAFAW